MTEKFSGKIIFNRDASSSRIERASFTVSEIIDDLYGLRSFVSNEVIVIFDSITHDLRVETYAPFIAMTMISLKYLSDNTPVIGAEVSLNGEGMSEEEPGRYRLDKIVFSPIIDMEIVGRTRNFDPYIVEGHELMIGNIALYVGLVVLALALVMRRALKMLERKRIAEPDEKYYKRDKASLISCLRKSRWRNIRRHTERWSWRMLGVGS